MTMWPMKIAISVLAAVKEAVRIHNLSDLSSSIDFVYTKEDTSDPNYRSNEKPYYYCTFTRTKSSGKRLARQESC